ncbi:MAG: hypothetical protein K1W34_02220 [Lachnospiraceae bacterium]
MELRAEDKFIAKVLFKVKVLQFKGQAFEDFFVSIMTKANTDFQAVKAYGNIGDRKNDGFIPTTGTYYQAFSPEDITINKTINEAVKKLEDDFKGLYENWNNTCKIKQYYFVINDRYQGLPPPIIQEAEELNKEYADIKIELFTAKDLEKVFGQLDEEEIFDVVGFIPDVSTGMIEFEALNEVVNYLLNIELPEGGTDKLIVPDFDEKILFNGLSDLVGAKLTTGSYQEGILQKYFNENPGIKELLQKKFHSLYLLSCEEIPDREENSADCRYYYILENASPKRTVAIYACVEVLMAYYFSSCDIFEEPG